MGAAENVPKPTEEDRTPLIVSSFATMVLLIASGISVFAYILSGKPVGLTIAGLTLGLAVLAYLVFFIAGYNILRRQYNAVAAAQRLLDAVLERRGMAPAELLEIASRASNHEFSTRANTSSRSAGAFVIGGFTVREAATQIESIPLYETAQGEVLTSEDELLVSAQAWVESARAYEDSRSTFPLLIVGYVLRNCFPSAFDGSTPNGSSVASVTRMLLICTVFIAVSFIAAVRSSEAPMKAQEASKSHKALPKDRNAGVNSRKYTGTAIVDGKQVRFWYGENVPSRGVPNRLVNAVEFQDKDSGNDVRIEDVHDRVNFLENPGLAHIAKIQIERIVIGRGNKLFSDLTLNETTTDRQSDSLWSRMNDTYRAIARQTFDSVYGTSK